MLGDVSREACNGLMRLPDRGRTLMNAFEDLKSRAANDVVPLGEFRLASGTPYSVSLHDLAPHGVASMYRSAAIITCGDGFLAVRLVQRLGVFQLDGYEAGFGGGPIRLVEVA